RVRKRGRGIIPPFSRIIMPRAARGLPLLSIAALPRRKLSEIRAKSEVPTFESIVAGLRHSLDELCVSRLQPVINGTGIVIHTNFGRAALAIEAVRALGEVASSYSNLEYDLVTGQRGGRGSYVETSLALRCP